MQLVLHGCSAPGNSGGHSLYPLALQVSLWITGSTCCSFRQLKAEGGKPVRRYTDAVHLVAGCPADRV